MRRRLALVVFAVAAMVTIAFLVPLAMVVRVVARDRALSTGEQEARSLAGVLAALGDTSTAAGILDQLNAGSDRRVALVLPDDRGLGAEVGLLDRELRLARTGQAFTASADEGRRIVVPVRTADGVTVVAVLVPSSALREGVAAAWAALAGVGVMLIGFGLVLADRLARPTVASVEELGRVTERLRAGDLDARVEPSGPPEVAAVGRTLNEFAARIDELLVGEREALADLSHRLRTPLTAMQLEVDGLRSAADRRRLGEAVSRAAGALSAFIDEARAPRSGGREPADLARIVDDRMSFWSVPAVEQEREWAVQTPERPQPVAAPADDVAAAVDALVANVFQHTPPGTPFSIAVTEAAHGAVLIVEDAGPGMSGTPRRGASGGGSTGLGLDIVRQTAAASGGDLAVERSAQGGARIVVRFGRPRPTAPRPARDDAGRSPAP